MIIGDAGYKQNLNIKVINFEDTSKQTCIYRSSEATLYVCVSVCQSIFLFYVINDPHKLKFKLPKTYSKNQ